MAKIRNRYNQAPHLTQDTNRKVTTSHLDISNENQEVSPFQSNDHTTSINRRSRKHSKKDRNNINDLQKKHHLGTVSKNILVEALNQFHGAPTSPLVQMWIKTLRCLVCMKKNLAYQCTISYTNHKQSHDSKDTITVKQPDS